MSFFNDEIISEMIELLSIGLTGGRWTFIETLLLFHFILPIRFIKNSVEPKNLFILFIQSSEKSLHQFQFGNLNYTNMISDI